MAAYEQIWREEEEALWDWLDDRVGLPENFVEGMLDERVGGARAARAQQEEPREDMSLSDRELEWAIGVTEEKLQVLRNSIRKKQKRKEVPRRSRNEGMTATEAQKAEASAEDVKQEL